LNKRGIRLKLAAKYVIKQSYKEFICFKAELTFVHCLLFASILALLLTILRYTNAQDIAVAKNPVQKIYNIY